MANTSVRTLRLLSLLQTHKYWPGIELADRLEVSGRTLRRDVERLRELGYPVQAHRGVDGGYQLTPGAALPPLMIDDEEAVALVVGMQAAVHGTVEGLAEPSVRVLAKVIQVLPPRLRQRVDALRTMTVPAAWSAPDGRGTDPVALTTVATACRDNERLRFDYTAVGGRRTQRHTEPHRLVALGRRWYLVAYDLDRHGWRSFRLDRLVDPSGDGSRFRPRELPAADAAEFVRAGMDQARRPHRIEVVVRAPAQYVRERIGRWCTVETIDLRHCRVLMSADSMEWPIMGLGTLNAEFDVIEPEALRDELRAWGARFARV
ncbi:helix-turn-helix transcriptional regulator [Nocardia callitridis]|uniref:YafY family protein n=1 Tax=Nocardia callitridis TaxID=648753 RepID=A0ABP9K6T3_9NOCA